MRLTMKMDLDSIKFNLNHLEYFKFIPIPFCFFFQPPLELISVFLNFFRTGQPSKHSIPNQIPVWPVYNLKSRQFLSIGK